MANKITITPEIKAEILKQYYDTDVEVKALAVKYGVSESDTPIQLVVFEGFRLPSHSRQAEMPIPQKPLYYTMF